MRTVSKLFFSIPFALVMGLVFAVSIATAIFIEARYGSETARALVYNTRWFEILLVGVIFGSKNSIVFSGAGILAGLFLQAAGMNGIDPKITTLPPVLKSIWLVIHVSVITSGYGFFGMTSILALFNLMHSYASSERAVLPMAAYTVAGV